MQIMDSIAKIKNYREKIKLAQSDPLTRFVIHPVQDQLTELQNVNLENLFQLARARDIRYLCIADGEICGCEKIDYNGWPAIWDIVKSLGFPGSCGNSDQYQAFDAGLAFPPSSIGGWDLVENRKLTEDEADRMKFSRVVSRKMV